MDEVVPGRRVPVGLIVGLGAVAICMVAPVIAVHSYEQIQTAPTGRVATGATAALGVLFRSSARNLVRGAMMTTMRTTSRAASRRVARRAARALAGTFVRSQAFGGAVEGALAGTVTGMVALALSLAAVLWLAPVDESAAILGGTPVWVLAMVGVVPAAVHLAATAGAARLLGVGHTIVSAADGLLLQAYFTVAGSFLPLAYDVQLEGAVEARARVGLAGIGALLGLYGLAAGLAVATGLVLFQQLAAVAVVYAFVFSFPLPPLDGGHLFAWRWWAWLSVAVVVLGAFASGLPEVWYGVI
ncbi:MAG: hypothetical protein H6732_07685 [Alphaproteobacteria bacterium]|nr:hypothetical protein [Alphaproteobacteria bacterium]